MSPSELMFGRAIRHPLMAVSSSDMMFTRTPGSEPESVTMLVQNSPRTIFVESKSSGTVRLAHVDQLKEVIRERPMSASGDGCDKLINSENGGAEIIINGGSDNDTLAENRPISNTVMADVDNLHKLESLRRNPERTARYGRVNRYGFMDNN